MFRKISLLLLLLVSFLFQSCYTIGYPTPCPGLVENIYDESEEACVDINY